MTIDYDAAKVSEADVTKAVAGAGYGAKVYDPTTAESQEDREEHKLAGIKNVFCGLLFYHSPLLYCYGKYGWLALT